MNKILPLLLAVMLVVSLAVPTFATEQETYDFGDVTLALPENITADMLNDPTFPYYVFLVGRQGIYVMLMSDTELNYNVGGFSNNSGHEAMLISSVTKDNGATWESSVETNSLANGKTFYPFLTTGAMTTRLLWHNEPVLCDGSTCPATDGDDDGICDECGLRLMRTSAPVVPSTYPTLPVVEGKNLHYVVLHREYGYFFMVLTSDTPYTVGGTVGDDYLITVANEQEVSYVTYTCTDGENWVQQNSGKAYATTVGSASSTLLASTFDWYKDGTLFFLVPLWEKLDRVTQGQMMGLTAETVGTMKILALCGVGCLALLVVLKLFGKRSLIYRN